MNLVFEIDKAIYELDHHDQDEANGIMVESDKELQRQRLIEWIKYEKVTILVAFSGGKDSVAMVLRLLELGIPKERIELWHHEVDGNGEQLFDWPCTPSYCQAFADHFNLKLLFSYRKGGIVREIYRQNENIQDVYFQDEPGGEYIHLPSERNEKNQTTRLKFPAISADLKERWCSSTTKIMVFSRAVNNMERLKNANILICTGERRDESRTRARYNEIEPYRSNTKTRRAIVWRLVIDMSDKLVWDLMRINKIQPHPAYELGYSRCSCQLCIFNSSNTWAANLEISPEKIERLDEIGSDIGFSLYQKTSVREKARMGKSFINEESRSKWLKQALGTFTSPIIANTWTLPQGAKSIEQGGAS